MSSFLDARCQGKGEEGGDGFWLRASRHRASTPALPGRRPQLADFPGKVGKRAPVHFLTRGTLMNKSPIN